MAYMADGPVGLTDLLPMLDAANDAHCGLVVFQRLFAMAAAAEKEVDLAAITDEPPLIVAKAAAAAINKATVKPASSTVTTTAAEDGATTATTVIMTTTTTTTTPSPAIARIQVPLGVRPQRYRAYSLWHDCELALDDVCKALRTAENPLARSTVM